MDHPVSVRGFFETESLVGIKANESCNTIVSFCINESPAGTVVESELCCAKETSAEIKKMNAKKTNLLN